MTPAWNISQINKIFPVKVACQSVNDIPIIFQAHLNYLRVATNTSRERTKWSKRNYQILPKSPLSNDTTSPTRLDTKTDGSSRQSSQLWLTPCLAVSCIQESRVETVWNTSGLLANGRRAPFHDFTVQFVNSHTYGWKAHGIASLHRDRVVVCQETSFADRATLERRIPNGRWGPTFRLSAKTRRLSDTVPQLRAGHIAAGSLLHELRQPI